jgi:hypothetical protein
MVSMFTKKSTLSMSKCVNFVRQWFRVQLPGAGTTTASATNGAAGSSSTGAKLAKPSKIELEIMINQKISTVGHIHEFDSFVDLLCQLVKEKKVVLRPDRELLRTAGLPGCYSAFGSKTWLRDGFSSLNTSKHGNTSYSTKTAMSGPGGSIRNKSGQNVKKSWSSSAQLRGNNKRSSTTVLLPINSTCSDSDDASSGSSDASSKGASGNSSGEDG